MGELNAKVPEQEGTTTAGPAPAAPGSAGAGVFSPAVIEAVRGFQTVERALPRNLSTGDVLALQRSAGNQAVARLIVPGRGHAALARQPAAAPAAPAPAAAPPGPTTAPPGTGPAAPGADGIDWDKFWAGSGPNEIRTVLEVLRLMPGWGLLAGGAADIINTKQDFEAIKGEDAPWIEGALALRSAVMITNNGVGHLVYVTELIQDLATASVVGAELDALTATVNEALLTVKVGLDGAQFLLDFGLVCGAKYRSMTAAPGSPSQGKWDGMVANYEANILGDLVGGVFDIMDLSSAGFANAGPVKAGAKAAKGVFDTAKMVKGLVKSVLQGWFGVWGSAGFEKTKGGGGVGRMAEQQAAILMLTELQSMKACYVVGDTIIGVAADLVAKQIAELNAAATIALGGKDPFITARDAAVEGLDTMQKRIGELAEMEVMASTASEKTAMVTAFADQVLGLLDAIVVPEITVPEADIGDDAVSDAAEGLLNLGGEIAGAGVNLLIGQLNGAVDEAKSSLRTPMEDLKTNAVDIGKFFQVVTDEARTQIQVGQTKVAEMGGKLAKCNSFEDIVNMIIDEIFELVGFHSDFEIDDIRQTWTAIGPAIDGAILWAEALRDGGQAPFPLFDDDPGAPVAAGAAGDPAQGGGAGGATGGGAPAGAGAGGGGGGAGGARDPGAAQAGAAAGTGAVIDVNQIAQAGAAAGAANAAQAGAGAAGGAAAAGQAAAGATGGAAAAGQAAAGATGGAAAAGQAAAAATGGAAGAAQNGAGAAGGAAASQTAAGAAGAAAGGVPEDRRRP